MFIPIRTDRSPRRKPVVTQSLLALNILIYLIGLIGHASGSFGQDRLAQIGHFDPQRFQLWQLFSSLFIHDPRSVWHLAFNMLFLWIFGASVESRLGRVSFLSLYLLGGAVANIAHMMVSKAPVIGASGAIAGLTGAFLALYPRSRVIVLFLFTMSFISVPSLWLIGLYFVVDVFRQTSEFLGGHNAGVAYMAHIAGYVYGFLLAFTLLGLGIIKREEFDIFFLFKQAKRRWAFRAVNRKQIAGAWESAPADTSDRLAKLTTTAPELTSQQQRIAEIRAKVNRLAAAHDLKAAAEQYRLLLREAPDTVFSEERQLELANQFCADQDHVHAAAAYELLLERFPSCAKASEVRLILGVMYTRELKRPERAREVIEAARLALREPGQTALADQLLAELNQ